MPISHTTDSGVAGSLFAEDQGLYVATVADDHLLEVLFGATTAGVELEPIGRTIARTGLQPNHLTTLGLLQYIAPSGLLTRPSGSPKPKPAAASFVSA